MSLTLNLPISGPGNGLWPAANPLKVRNVSASSIASGRTVMLCLEGTTDDADVTSFTPGSVTAGGADNSVFACVILPDANGIKFGQLLVLEDTIAAGGTGKAYALIHPITAFVDGSGTNITAGAPLIANTAGALVIAPAAGGGGKIVGYLSQQATVTTATTAPVWFNGMGAGFGNNAAS